MAVFTCAMACQEVAFVVNFLKADSDIKMLSKEEILPPTRVFQIERRAKKKDLFNILSVEVGTLVSNKQLFSILKLKPHFFHAISFEQPTFRLFS